MGGHCPFCVSQDARCDRLRPNRSYPTFRPSLLHFCGNVSKKFERAAVLVRANVPSVFRERPFAYPFRCALDHADQRLFHR